MQHWFVLCFNCLLMFGLLVAADDKPYVKVIDVNDINDAMDYNAMATGGSSIDYPEARVSLVSSANSQSNQLVPPYIEVPPEYRRVCIYPNWSIMRESHLAKIYPEDIDANLCTHIHYAYANIDVKTLQLSPSQYQDFNSGEHGAPLYDRIMKLRQMNPNLKILISIGGWFAKSTPFNRILTNEITRNTFIQNTLNFLRNWKFDGLDIQWEYPGDIEYGATSDSKQRFTSLLRNLHKAFKEEYKSTFKKYILTAFVPPEEARIDAGYQVKLVCRYLDYISVATYDYTGPYDTKTGYNSPLYSRTHIQNSVNTSIHYWLERGCPAKKVLLGIPTYARAFKIIKRSNSPNLLFVGIESEPFVSPSVYTSEEGILSYYEVCEMMSNKETRVYWDDLAEVPFAIIMGVNDTDSDSSNLWISYEDARSARKKVEYAKKMSLGGVSIWSLDMDDFKGLFCNLGPFPIIEAVKEEFEHKVTLIDQESENQIESNQPQQQQSSDNDEQPTVEETETETEIELEMKKPPPAKPQTHTTTTKHNSHADLTTTTKLTKTPKRTKTSTSRVATTKLIDNKISNTTRKYKDIKSELEQFKKNLKKFKAVREIKLITCLDKKLCTLSSSSARHKHHFSYKIFSFLLFFFSLY